MQKIADSSQLYLDLLKKSLTFLLWEEPGLPIQEVIHRMPTPIRWGVKAFSGLMSRLELQLTYTGGRNQELREEGRTWPLLADTMIGVRRLDNLQRCVTSVIEDDIPGDLIETGVWRGGASIFMRAVLAAYGVTDRRVFVADSFEGLPPPNTELYPQDAGDLHHKIPLLGVTQQDVEDNFEKYGLLDEQVVFLKGWFRDTLPSAPIEELAIIRSDGDMYESTIDTLTNLYPKLSEGGYCIIDDYGALECCRRAVEDYRKQHGIECPIEEIDWTGVYWRKGQV